MPCSACLTAACAARRSRRRAPSSTPRPPITAARSSPRFSRSKTASPRSITTTTPLWRRRPRSTPRSARSTYPWRSTCKGATDYLTVVTSQTALLQTQLEALNLDTLQLRASVDLIRALGGGWEDSKMAQSSRRWIHSTRVGRLDGWVGPFADEEETVRTSRRERRSTPKLNGRGSVYSSRSAAVVLCELTQLRRRRRETLNHSKPVPSKSRVAGSGTDAGLSLKYRAAVCMAWKDGAAAEPSLKNPTMYEASGRPVLCSPAATCSAWTGS